MWRDITPSRRCGSGSGGGGGGDGAAAAPQRNPAAPPHHGIAELQRHAAPSPRCRLRRQGLAATVTPTERAASSPAQRRIAVTTAAQLAAVHRTQLLGGFGGILGGRDAGFGFAPTAAPQAPHLSSHQQLLPRFDSSSSVRRLCLPHQPPTPSLAG